MSTLDAISSPRENAPAWSPEVRVQRFGISDYEPVWRAMRAYTADRHGGTADEIWLLQHAPVYTLGIAARAEHLPRPENGIPLVCSDRGGQITYHGPGQLVAYLLLDLRRRALGVRGLVRRMEQAVIDLLGAYGHEAQRREAAPGVYIGAAKIAALGLRVRNGCCYHGIALNVDMDLTPFLAIDPCGYPGLAVTQTRDLGIGRTVDQMGTELARHLMRALQ